jgi:hypothetical protein
VGTEQDSIIPMQTPQRLGTPTVEEFHVSEHTDRNYLSDDAGLLHSELAEDIDKHGYESNMTLGMGGENNFETFTEPKSDIKVPMPVLNQSGIETGNITPDKNFSPPRVEAESKKNEPVPEKSETEPENNGTEPEGTELNETDDEYDTREEFYREIVPREYGLISEILENYIFTDCSDAPDAHLEGLFIKFSDNSKCLVNSGTDFCQIDLETNKYLNKSTNDHTSNIVGAIYTGEQDQFIMSADVQNTIIIRDSDTFTELTRFKNSEDPLERILRISPSTCGRYIAVAGMEDISIYNNKWEVVLQYPNHHSDELIFLEFHGEITYVCSADHKIIKTVNLEEEIFYPDIIPNHLTETGEFDP